MEEISLLKRKLDREIKARKAAESILEKKALQLFESKRQLEQANLALNKTIKDKESEIVEREKRFSSLVNTINHIILNIDLSGQVSLSNKAAKEYFDSSDFNLFDYIDQKDDFIKALKALDHSANATILIEQKLNNQHILEMSISISEVDSQKAFSIIARDITKEITQAKKLENTLQLLEQSEFKAKTIFANMKLGMLEVDTEGVIMECNQSFSDLCGYTREELIGKNPEEFLLGTDSKQVIRDQNVNRLEGGYSVYELTLKHKKGHLIHVIISGAPIMDREGVTIGSVGIHYDITYQKDLQKEIIAAKNNAEKAREKEKSFLNTVSHEIITPLNAIAGMIDLLREARLEDPYSDYVKVIEGSSKSLLSLISNYLEMSSNQAVRTKIEKRSFELNTFFADVYETIMAQHIEDQKITIDAVTKQDETAIAHSNTEILKKVIINLVGQLFKMTTDGPIGLKYNCFEEYGVNYLRVIIKSPSLYLSEQEMDNIFLITKEKSTQFDVNEENLNLVMSQHLIRSLNAEILVDSNITEGTSFSFLVEVDKDLIGEQDGAVPQGAIDISQLHVLVVEDNPVNQKYLSAILEKEKISYSIASNGKLGFDKTNEEKFDLIFMDIHMPVMDGIECSKKIIQESRLNKNTPIIALTASNVNDEKIRALEAGMTDFVTKPFLPDTIYKLLQSHTALDHDRIQEIVEESNAFDFDPKLDKDALDRFFAGNLEYIYDMFSVFCEELPIELATITGLQSGIDASKLAHKLKPSFEMVGFTSIARTLADIESQKNEEGLALFLDNKDELNAGLQLIEKETKRLYNWIHKI